MGPFPHHLGEQPEDSPEVRPEEEVDDDADDDALLVPEDFEDARQIGELPELGIDRMVDCHLGPAVAKPKQRKKARGRGEAEEAPR